MCWSDKEGLESGGEREDSGKKGHKVENILLVEFRKIKLPQNTKVFHLSESEEAEIAEAVWHCHLTWKMTGNISYLVYFGWIKCYKTAPVLVWVTLRYDTHSWLLIRPCEKQQVDVRKVINHSGNMCQQTCCFPLFRSLYVSAKWNCWRMCSVSRCVCPTHICPAHHFCLAFCNQVVSDVVCV